MYQVIKNDHWVKNFTKRTTAIKYAKNLWNRDSGNLIEVRNASTTNIVYMIDVDGEIMSGSTRHRMAKRNTPKRKNPPHWVINELKQGQSFATTREAKSWAKEANKYGRYKFIVTSAFSKNDAFNKVFNKKKRNPPLNKWIPAKAVKFLGKGIVQILK